MKKFCNQAIHFTFPLLMFNLCNKCKLIIHILFFLFILIVIGNIFFWSEIMCFLQTHCMYMFIDSGTYSLRSILQLLCVVTHCLYDVQRKTSLFFLGEERIPRGHLTSVVLFFHGDLHHQAELRYTWFVVR